MRGAEKTPLFHCEYCEKLYLCTRLLRKLAWLCFKRASGRSEASKCRPMNPLLPFTIPVRGLRTGISEYDFVIDERFFAAFEVSPLEKGDVRVHLIFDKSPRMWVLDFAISGTVRTDCDRCLAPIDLPIEDRQQLIVKLSEQPDPDEDADVVFVDPETARFNVAQYVYEFIVLAMPLIKAYDCRSEANPPCDEDLLARLEAQAFPEEAEATPDEEQDSPWDELKDWMDKQNN